ncbi:cytochrome c oxidase subunit I [Leifsonia sp. NPDC080035]|uniref:Cytochrome c oxidase subunit 1 n=1 Tax=Leifsonia sp. NPDC080035 TaxID=3143936 RepID=A0AAU7GG98_9MICO
MTAITTRPDTSPAAPVGAPARPPARATRKGNAVVAWITSTDHKTIGFLYMIASGVFFGVGGVMALLIRAQLFEPGLNIVSPEQYNQLFTMHGTVMLLLYAMPFFTGAANFIIPLQIGAPDVAFPRLNAFSFWLFLSGGLIAAGGFLTPQGAADFGWFAYQPLAGETFSPGSGGSLWFGGAILLGFATIFSSVNFITTIVCMRAPGMTMFRMPVFSWTTMVTSILALIAFPVLAAALVGAMSDRVFGSHLFEAATGGALMWQHLFWFWGHPEVYVIVLPFFGIISEVLPVFSRKPIFGYKTLVYATISIAALSVTVWAHHMYVTGSVLLPWFSLMTMLIAVPTGVKLFNWVGTMWRGSMTFESPMLFAIGFLINFTFGGLTGVILASPPLDFHVSDTYFVVAHFHYVLFGAVVFASFAGIHFWWPKWTGRMLNEKLGYWTFWLLFIGFNTTFLIQHWLGVIGMPRRYASYLPTDGFTWMNQVSTVGAIITGVALLPFILNVYVTMRKGSRVATDDPWGTGRSLEWATSSPPPRHNFVSIPRIRSESPAFDLHHGPAAMAALAAKTEAGEPPVPEVASR